MRSVTRAHDLLQALHPLDGNVTSIAFNQRTRLAILLFPHVRTEDDLLPDHLFIARVLDRYLEKMRPAARQKRRKLDSKS